MNKTIKELFAQQYSLKKGNIIKTSSSLSDSVFLLEKGYIKESIVNSQGIEVATRIIKPQTIFPFTEPDEGDIIQFIYESYTDAVISSSSRQKFLSEFNKIPELVDLIQINLLKQLLDFKKRLFYLNTGDAFSKVIFILDYLAENYKDERKTNQSIEIPLSQKEIGLFIGLSRESVGMQIKKLVETGKVTFSHNKLIINQPQQLLSKNLA